MLIDWDPRYLYRQLFDDETAMGRFLHEVVSPEWNLRQDEGRPWTDAIGSLATDYPDQRDLIVAFRDRWVEMLGGPIDGTTAVLEELRLAGVRTYALSNWSAETFPLARPMFPFLEWFDGIVLSGEVGIAKPDPRIFQILFERFELEPSATLFIDDSLANVEAAAELGMVAVRFVDADTLRGNLVDLGLLEAQV